jgi:hypothetical protein
MGHERAKWNRFLTRNLQDMEIGTNSSLNVLATPARKRSARWVQKDSFVVLYQLCKQKGLLTTQGNNSSIVLDAPEVPLQRYQHLFRNKAALLF